MNHTSGLQAEYSSYDRQRCFVAHSLGAEWTEDLKSACASILPKFNLEPWYAADHFDPTQPLRDKVVELIANSRYGIYDISSWQDKQGNWQLPRNVFIELGIAIALNRPTLLLRHSSNKNLPLPVCLQGIETVEFAGDFTLKKELEKRLPQWLDVPPDSDWLNRFCIFSDRVCSFREQHPYSQQWGQKTLHCHIADGLDKQHPNYCQSERDEIRGAFEEIFSRYSDLEFSYLDERSTVDGYQFLLCSHCQTVRSTPFAIYRISPTTSAETFVAIGISIALEKLFAYDIPKILLVRQVQDTPSLLLGPNVIEAVSTNDIKRQLKAFLPQVTQIVRKTSWQSRPLPFFEASSNFVDEPETSLQKTSSSQFEYDIFMSYATLDNQSFSKSEGWISEFTYLLEQFIGNNYPKKLKIYNPQLGNSTLGDSIEAIKKSAIFLAFLSPAYVDSRRQPNWCQLEAQEFYEYARRTIGMNVDNRVRVFKILLAPMEVEEQQPEYIRGLVQGHNFYESDETGKIIQLRSDIGDEFRRKFNTRVNRLSIEIAKTLNLMNLHGFIN